MINIRKGFLVYVFVKLIVVNPLIEVLYSARIRAGSSDNDSFIRKLNIEMNLGLEMVDHQNIETSKIQGFKN